MRHTINSEPRSVNVYANLRHLQLAKTDAVILSYSRVKTITGLTTLKSLVKLRLDNNEIGVFVTCANYLAAACGIPSPATCPPACRANHGLRGLG